MKIRAQADRLAQGYPALLAEAQRIAQVVASGEHGRRRAGAGETFWQYRNYQTTDAANRIDWRRSARGDQIFVRDNEWEAAQSLYLWRDGDAGLAWRSDKALPTKADRASVLLLALAHLLTRAGERCAVAGPDAPRRSGRVGYEKLALDLLHDEGSVEAFEAEMPRHAKMILASDFLEPIEVWQTRLSRLASRPMNGVLIQVADPAESQFPYSGRLDLRLPRTPKLGGFLLGRAEKAKEEYQALYAAHNTALKQTAARLGWTLIRHQTDQPPAQALAALYQILSGDR